MEAIAFLKMNFNFKKLNPTQAQENSQGEILEEVIFRSGANRWAAKGRSQQFALDRPNGWFEVCSKCQKLLDEVLLWLTYRPCRGVADRSFDERLLCSQDPS